ncbi:MAG: LptF/LptG family permease [Rickettsiales bacterium]|nr:LptF/LptG family permease [Rickettsiales bacterium]
MRLYKKYLIGNLFKPLIVSLTTLVLIIWSSRVVKFMDYVVEDGAKFASFFKLTLLILPSLVLTILPLTIFLTVILTYNKLIENREIIILKNCGIKKSQLLNPLIVLAAIIVVFSYFISLYGSYKSSLMVRELKQEIQNNISFSMVKEGSFIKFKNIVIYADKKDKNKIFNVLIYNQAKTEEKKNFLLQAKMAEINANIITLYDGNFQQFTSNYEKAPEIVFFKKYYINLDDLINEQNVSIFKTDSVSTLELIKIIKNYDDYKQFFPNKNKVIYELNYRLTFPLLSIIIAFLSGSLMLEATFNRVSNSKILLKTSIISGSVYIILLSLYQKVADGLIFLYILYVCIMLLLLLSFIMIRERNNVKG